MEGSKTHQTLGILVAALTAALAVLALPAGARAASPAAEGLDKLRSLAGEWRGTNDQGHPVRLSYELVADGSAVLEHLYIDGDARDHNMVTLYHLDGDELMLTHYCAANNQPRMRAASVASDEIRFEFVDATNLASPEDGHMHRAKFAFAGDDRLTSAWTWYENGAAGHTAVIDVERVASR